MLRLTPKAEYQQTLVKFILTVALGFLQLIMLPTCFGSSSATWDALYAISLLSFLILSLPIAIVGTRGGLAMPWRAAFIVYLGTIGSSVFSVPSVAFLLILCSWPAIVLRFLGESRPPYPPEWPSDVGPLPLGRP